MKFDLVPEYLGVGTVHKLNKLEEAKLHSLPSLLSYKLA
jgi:hypothetical protein